MKFSFDSFNNNKMRSNLSKEELKALHNLRKQKHLVMQKADKGNTVVITEKNVYINRMKEIISDTTKFEQINIEQEKQLNFLLKSEKKVIDLIKRLENEGKISEKEYELILDQVFCTEVPKSINQLLITAPNSYFVNNWNTYLQVG